MDNAVFIVSGSAGEWSSLLWPHRWAIYDRNVTLNGKGYDFNLQLKDFLAHAGWELSVMSFFILLEHRSLSLYR